MEVEARLDRRISQLTAEMNNWSAQLAERIDRLLSATPSVAAAAAAAPSETDAAATPTPLPGQAPRLDPWAQSRAGAPETQLQSYLPESPEAAGGIGQPLRAPHPKEVDKPKVYDGNATAWLRWNANFKRLRRRND